MKIRNGRGEGQRRCTILGMRHVGVSGVYVEKVRGQGWEV